jgi:hypothetical protein
MKHWPPGGELGGGFGAKIRYVDNVEFDVFSIDEKRAILGLQVRRPRNTGIQRGKPSAIPLFFARNEVKTHRQL